MNKKIQVIATLLLLAAPGAFGTQATEEMMDAQSRLKSVGFYYGEIDGLDGPETRAAIKRFQIRNGLSVNGMLDAQTKAALLAQGSQDIHSSTQANNTVPSAPASSTPAPKPTPKPASKTTSAPSRKDPVVDLESAKATPPSSKEFEAAASADRAFLQSQVGVVVPDEDEESTASVPPERSAVTFAPGSRIYRGIAVEPPGEHVYQGRVVNGPPAAPPAP